ncbi:STAS domain-containing protein [Solihabitans fulvus]|uniref:Anti-sigma factor antagonist n=1 Tax=Solihabitans fulvus TaxID=1892852 RepID=A0A5B2X3X9_9PSEU|nr:STAS domain-containing protein [Solihabitans fulvus]KAA2257903.1 STAS domain-containing protein [Solihabitans fulvus]
MAASAHQLDAPATPLSTPRLGHGLLLHTRWAPPSVAVVKVAGEVDMLTAPTLAACLLAGLARWTPRRLVVDLRRVGFLSVAGLGVLIEANEQAGARHVELRLVADTRTVRRALMLAAATHPLVVCATLAAALPGGIARPTGLGR